MEQETSVATVSSTVGATNPNPFNVEPGQGWKDTDGRRSREIRVTSVDVAAGLAHVVNAETGRRGRIRLERFSPTHHMRKV